MSTFSRFSDPMQQGNHMLYGEDDRSHDITETCDWKDCPLCNESSEPDTPLGLEFIGKQENGQGLPTYDLFNVLSGPAKGNTIVVKEGENPRKHWREVENKFKEAK